MYGFADKSSESVKEYGYIIIDIWHIVGRMIYMYFCVRVYVFMNAYFVYIGHKLVFSTICNVCSCSCYEFNSAMSESFILSCVKPWKFIAIALKTCSCSLHTTGNQFRPLQNQCNITPRRAKQKCYASLSVAAYSILGHVYNLKSSACGFPFPE